MRLLRLVLLAALLGACGGGTSGTTLATLDPGADLPAWLRRVSPVPGASTAGATMVEVEHDLQGPDEDIRLLIDGVDVTTYASLEGGVLVYESGEGPVTLQPGRHRATAQRVSLPVQGAEPVVLESFTWAFSVL